MGRGTVISSGQMIGAMLGAVLVYLVYSNHWKLTESQGDKLGIFATGPARPQLYG